MEIEVKQLTKSYIYWKFDISRLKDDINIWGKVLKIALYSSNSCLHFRKTKSAKVF